MIKKLIKEPLFHFIIGGIMLFFIFELFGNDNTANNKTIQITKGQIDLMYTHWQRQLGRLPTETELQGLIDDHIREEILMQEALAMGLDKDDIIIRRRLAQKMEFVAGDMLTVKEPTSNEIKTYYESHKNELKESGEISFLQIFFNVDKRKPETSESLASNLKYKLNGMDISDLDITKYGDQTMLRSNYPDLQSDRLSSQFGETEIVEQLLNSPLNKWVGPVSSNYGLHLIYVLNRKPGYIPEFKDVSEKIKGEMIAIRKEKLDKKFMARLREQYTIEINNEVFKKYHYKKEKY
ncbi:MAG: peptidyl-prolyl cis-trans isomerase [Flavobacteriaceae bacterium]|nr:peptidyl-prolyl cis-trans isomerase [Flavobacteriaceae bacterium]